MALGSPPHTPDSMQLSEAHLAEIKVSRSAKKRELGMNSNALFICFASVSQGQLFHANQTNGVAIKTSHAVATEHVKEALANPRGVNIPETTAGGMGH